MLNCVYHPDFPMRVVEDDIKETLLTEGWFNSPDDAAKAKKLAALEKRNDEHEKAKRDENGSNGLHDEKRKGRKNHEQKK